MKNSASRRFPVTVTRLPIIRCQVCQRAVPCRDGQASAAMTEHYRRQHPDLLDAPAR
jgi:hypothetical protein